jgi:hypothetical protein
MAVEPQSRTAVQTVDLQISYASATATQISAWRWLWKRLLSGGETTRSSPDVGENNTQGSRS